jgi:hypothetical protein
MKRLLNPYSDNTKINRPLSELDGRLLKGVYTADKWEHAEGEINDLKYTYNMERNYEVKPMVPDYSHVLDFDKMVAYHKWYRINKEGKDEVTVEEPI